MLLKKVHLTTVVPFLSEQERDFLATRASTNSDWAPIWEEKDYTENPSLNRTSASSIIPPRLRLFTQPN